MKYEKEAAKKYIKKFKLSPNTQKTWEHRGEMPDYLQYGSRIDVDSKLLNIIRIVYSNKYLKYRRFSKKYSIITEILFNKTKTISITDLHIELEAIETIKQELQNFLATEVSTEESYINYFYDFVVKKESYITYSKDLFPNHSKKYNRFYKVRHKITKADLLEDVAIIKKNIYEDIWGEGKNKP